MTSDLELGPRRHASAAARRGAAIAFRAGLLLAIWCAGAQAHDLAPDQANPPSASCKQTLDCRVANATQVVVYRLRMLREIDLETLNEGTAPAGEHAALSPAAARDLIRFVRDDATYLLSPGVASSCAFRPHYAFAFASPRDAAAWWLVANDCRRAVLVSAKSNAGEWTDSARFLSPAAIERLKKCNGGDGADWSWANEKSCLAD